MKIVNDYKYTDNNLQFTKNKNAFNKRLKSSLFSIAAEVFENMLKHQQTQKKKIYKANCIVGVELDSLESLSCAWELQQHIE